MKTIPLTQGKVTIVDDQDYERFADYRWHAAKNYGTYYVMRHSPRNGGRGRIIRLHREIMNAGPGQQCDHINGDGLDNRRCNLRLCTRAENMHNRRPQNGGTSQFKGVYLHKATGSWLARITHNGKTWHLGLFDDETEAAIAYDDAAHQDFGEFARVNFP